MAERHDQNPLALLKAREVKPSKPNHGLTPRIRKAVDFMVFGHPDHPNENLTGQVVADLVGLTWRTLREALAKPVVKKYFNDCYNSLREAEKPASVRRAVDIRDDPNLKGHAAGRKTQLDAAKLLLSEPVGLAVQVNQQFNTITGQPITPGYIVDLREDETRPGIRRDAALYDGGPVIDQNFDGSVS